MDVESDDAGGSVEEFALMLGAEKVDNCLLDGSSDCEMSWMEVGEESL